MAGRGGLTFIIRGVAGAGGAEAHFLRSGGGGRLGAADLPEAEAADAHA